MKNSTRGFSLSWVIGIVIVTSIISGLTAGLIVYNNSKLSTNLTYGDLSNDEALNEFLTVYANILSEYYEDVDKNALVDEAIAGMMEYLGDDYTTYLDNETTQSLMDGLSGKYEGIGVSINNETKTIVKVYEDTPAYKAGIKEGDIIIGYNDTDVTNMSTNEIVELIKNSENNFNLKLQRNDEVITVTLKVEELITPNIEYEMVENTKIGYIYIETFSNTLEEQISKALTNLENQGMESLIIDVRDNTGGYLTSVTDVASIFLKKGQIIYSLKDDKVINYKDETSESKDYSIVVLINGNTASAAEILAAALKDNLNATLVGETTFGKGKVQKTIELDDGSMVKYTSSYWLTPNGSCIDEVGIKPDYAISNIINKDENGQVVEIIDQQLEKAISILSE